MADELPDVVGGKRAFLVVAAQMQVDAGTLAQGFESGWEADVVARFRRVEEVHVRFCPAICRQGFKARDKRRNADTASNPYLAFTGIQRTEIEPAIRTFDKDAIAGAHASG